MYWELSYRFADLPGMFDYFWFARHLGQVYAPCGDDLKAV